MISSAFITKKKTAGDHMIFAAKQIIEKKNYIGQSVRIEEMRGNFYLMST